MWEERLACPESAYCCSASIRSPVDSCWRFRQPPNVQYASDVRPGRSYYYLLVSQPIKPFTPWLTSTEQGSGTDCPFKGQKEQEEESLVLVPQWLIQTVSWCCVVKDTDMRESLPYYYIWIKLFKKKVLQNRDTCVLDVTNYAKPHLDLWPFLEPDLGEERLVAALQPTGHGRAQFEKPTESSHSVGPPPTGRGTWGRVSLSCVVGPRSADP